MKLIIPRQAILDGKSRLEYVDGIKEYDRNLAKYLNRNILAYEYLEEEFTSFLRFSTSSLFLPKIAKMNIYIIKDMETGLLYRYMQHSSNAVKSGCSFSIDYMGRINTRAETDRYIITRTSIEDSLTIPSIDTHKLKQNRWYEVIEKVDYLPNSSAILQGCITVHLRRGKALIPVQLFTDGIYKNTYYYLQDGKVRILYTENEEHYTSAKEELADVIANQNNLITGEMI